MNRFVSSVINECVDMEDDLDSGSGREDAGYRCQCGKQLKGNSDYVVRTHEQSAYHQRWVAAAKMPSIMPFLRPTPARAPQAPTTASVVAADRDSDCVLIDSLPGSSSDGPPAHAPSPAARAGAGDEAPAPPRPCPGVSMIIPRHVKGGSFLDNYPTRLEGRPWRVDSEGSAWSLRCDQLVCGDGPCRECERVPHTRQWKDMVKSCGNLAADGPRRVPNAYLTRMALEDKVKDAAAERQRLRLRSLNDARRTATLIKGVSTYQRFAQCLATRDVKRARQIIAAELKRGASIAHITELLEQAAEGVYSRKKWEKEEEDFCVFLLLIGGGRIAESLHHHVGLASYSTIRRMGRTQVRFRLCHAGFDHSIVTAGRKAIDSHSVSVVCLRIAYHGAVL
eukprot:GHVU01007760.1.p1 GENE.GHVU01007760.1~~GHVU01007760.1.p1  ORF type:complete len:394 (-),score=34.98 GHVU01007760.1:116-1297(-)